MLTLLLPLVIASSAFPPAARTPTPMAPHGLFPPADENGTLTCRRPVRTLRSVRRGRLLVPMFVLENKGKNEVVIERIVASKTDVKPRLRAGMKEIPLPDDPNAPIGLHVAAKQIIHLSLQIPTRTLDGPQQRKVTVYYDGPDPASLEVMVDFTVTKKAVEPPSRSNPKDPKSPPAKPTGPQPKLVASEFEIDLGEVTAGEKKTHTFVIGNDGEAPLQISSIRTACGCALSRRIFREKEELDFDRLESTESHVIVKPGEKLRIRLVIDAATTREGPLEEKITLLTNDFEHPKAVFKATARVSRGFVIEPKALVFPDTPKGREQHGRVELELTHLEGCRVTDVQSSEPYIRVAWKEINPPSQGTPARYTIEVTLTDQAPGGKQLRWLTATTTHERVRVIKIPITANIIPNITFRTTNAANPERIDFGIISTSDPIVREVEIVNTEGELPYRIKGIEVNSPQADLIDVEPITIEDGTHYRLRVTLRGKPDARMVTGTIVVTSDHVDLPRKEIRFRGWVTRKKP